MTTNHPATELQVAVRANDTKLFASLELSKSQWLVTVSAPGSVKLSKHAVIGGDGSARTARSSWPAESRAENLQALVAAGGTGSKQAGCPMTISVVPCKEHRRCPGPPNSAGATRRRSATRCAPAPPSGWRP